MPFKLTIIDPRDMSVVNPDDYKQYFDKYAALRYDDFIDYLYLDDIPNIYEKENIYRRKLTYIEFHVRHGIRIRKRTSVVVVLNDHRVMTYTRQVDTIGRTTKFLTSKEMNSVLQLVREHYNRHMMNLSLALNVSEKSTTYSLKELIERNLTVDNTLKDIPRNLQSDLSDLGEGLILDES